MRNRLLEEGGAIAVETALTLPLVLLLTLGGISVLWWLHHKTWLHVLVSETARERAADATWTGYYKDIRDSLTEPDQGFGLEGVRLLSFHLPTDPPFVMVGACTAPAGHVPTLPSYGEPGDPPRPGGGGWLQPVRDLRWELTRLLERARRLTDQLEDYADAGVAAGERLIWYRRVAENLAEGGEFERRQAIDYIAGGLLEEAMQYPCRGDDGDTVMAAKAVIHGERTFGQR